MRRIQWKWTKMWLFLNNFSASINWFWWFETLLEQSWNCLLFPEWNRIGIFCGNGGKNCPSPILGTFWENEGSGKIISQVAGAQLASFYSITVPLSLYSFSGIRHVCHDNDGWFVYADPCPRPVEHIFIAFRTFDFLDKHISVQQNLMINS